MNPIAFVQANTNGRLHSAAEPSVAPLDRGFLYGDSIYEVWRTYDGVVFTWDEHYDRLERSAASLYLSLPWTRAEMWEQVARTAAAYRGATGFAGELYIRLQVSRGAGAIGLDPALADRAGFVLLVQPTPLPPAEARSRGLRLTIARSLHRNPVDCLNPAWKTGNYLNNVLCFREARARGYDEVLMLNQRGEATEASTSNLAFVRAGEVITPPMEAGILGGITRGLVLGRIAPALGLRMREEVVVPGDFAGMDECFLMSTTKDITPVAAIDEARFAVPAGGVGRRVFTAFDEYARAEARAHPERRV